MYKFSGSSQNPGSNVHQLSNGHLGKSGEESIAIVHPSGDKGMNKFLHSCSIFEMIRSKALIHL